MGRIEQNPDLIISIGAAHNKVFMAESQKLGSNEHAIALVELARLVANNAGGLTIVRDLNKPKTK